MGRYNEKCGRHAANRVFVPKTWTEILEVLRGFSAKVCFYTADQGDTQMILTCGNQVSHSQ